MRQALRTILSPRMVDWRPWVLPLVLLLLWASAVGWQWVQSPILVSPTAVWHRATQQLSSAVFWDSLGASLYRDASGLAIGSALGLLFGSWLGLSRLAEQVLGPSLHTLKQISLFAWIPLLSVWFGLGDSAKIAFIALAAFFPVVLNTLAGIRSVPRELLDVARVYQFSVVQLWLRVVLPSAAPSIFTGFHLAIIYTWLATIGSEYLLVSGQGIGNTLIDGREHFWMDLVLFGVIVIGLVGSLLNHGLLRLEKRWLAWRDHTVARY